MTGELIMALSIAKNCEKGCAFWPSKGTIEHKCPHFIRCDRDNVYCKLLGTLRKRVKKI